MIRNFLHLTILLFFCQGYTQECGFFADASGLYWQAHENGLAYAVKSRSVENLASSKIKNPDFDWDFGFRVGIGYCFSHEEWNLLLQFTSLQTHATNDTYGEILFPSWQIPMDGGPFFAEHVHTHWRLHLGIVDLMLRKCYPVSKSFSLTPQVGIRAGSIRQKYYIDYIEGSFASSGDEIVHMKNKFFGIGPNAGLQVDLSLGKGFGLFVKSLFSVLFGEFFLHQNEYSRGGEERTLGVRDLYSSAPPVMDFSAGVYWQQHFSGTLKRIGLAIAWDELFCFSQNQLLRFTSADSKGVFFSNQGDLIVSGIELAMRFDF